MFSLLKYLPLFLGASCLAIYQGYPMEKFGLFWLIIGIIFIILGIFVLLLTSKKSRFDISSLEPVLQLFMLPVKLVLFVIKLLN